jgi:hypothetical protein
MVGDGGNGVDGQTPIPPALRASPTPKPFGGQTATRRAGDHADANRGAIGPERCLRHRQPGRWPWPRHRRRQFGRQP